MQKVRRRGQSVAAWRKQQWGGGSKHRHASKCTARQATCPGAASECNHPLGPCSIYSRQLAPLGLMLTPAAGRVKKQCIDHQTMTLTFNKLRSRQL